MIDQFVAAARAKWRQHASLVLLLPHGYEGQGPEHSSGRLERYLQLAAEDNLRVANCTTAAQYFHLLRAQAASLADSPRPLVVMTPKSLLRHPLAASSLRDLAEGHFQSRAGRRAGARTRRCRARQVRRLILCSGKVAVDLDRRGAETAGDGAGGRGGARRAAVPLPGARDRAPVRQLPQRARGRLATGGAAQHGRVELRREPRCARCCRRARRCATSGGRSARARPRATRRCTCASRRASSTRRLTNGVS